MDINELVDVTVEGFVSKNTNGVWRLVCAVDGAQTAGQVCTLLGFSGYISYELRTIPTEQVGQFQKPVETNRYSFNKHLESRYDIERYRRDLSNDFDRHGHGHHGHHNKRPHHHHHHHKKEPIRQDAKCEGLYVECTPHANGNTTIHAPVVPPKKPVKTIVGPIIPLIRPGLVPNITVYPETEKHKEDSKEPDTQNEWPWLANIYVNGYLRCIGILLDRHWVIANELCVNRTM